MICSERILGIGSPIVDFLVQVDTPFLEAVGAEKGGMVLISSEEMDVLLAKLPGTPLLAPGGSAGNTIFGLAKLEDSTAFLGKLGNDAAGNFYRSKLVEVGGSDKSFRVIEGGVTGRCLSMITPDSERTMRTDLGIASSLSPADISEADFEQIDHVHVEGYLLFLDGVTEKILATAKACGCTISLDLATFELVRLKRDRLAQLLKEYVDVVFANEAEAAEFSGSPEPAEQAAALARFCPITALKLGPAGCYLQDESGIYTVPAKEVEVVDTTAAGDLWAAGFLHGWVNGCPLSRCGEFGTIAAAEVIQVMGSQISEERWEIINKQLEL
ncbi:MAG: adenosine kinase [Victivallaceae bacterium]|nr:adenosine kinase [Victivallaceae bacterium]